MRVLLCAFQAWFYTLGLHVASHLSITDKSYKVRYDYIVSTRTEALNIKRLGQDHSAGNRHELGFEPRPLDIKWILPPLPPLLLLSSTFVRYDLPLDHCGSLHLPVSYPTSCYWILFPKPGSQIHPSKTYHKRQGLSIDASRMNETCAPAASASVPLQTPWPVRQGL